MSVTRGREAAFFFSNYRIRVLRFLYGTLLSAYQKRLGYMSPAGWLKHHLHLSSLSVA